METKPCNEWRDKQTVFCRNCQKAFVIEPAPEFCCDACKNEYFELRMMEMNYSEQMEKP